MSNSDRKIYIFAHNFKVGDIVLYHDSMGYSHTGKIEKVTSGKYQYKIENVDGWYREDELKKINE